MVRDMRKWDARFISMAALISSWSKDPSTKCGAVIVDEFMRVVSMGYNGFARGVGDDTRLENRAVKNKIVLHAEVNTILFARRSVEGCTMYIYSSLPCGPCAALIVQSGIKTVVVPALGYNDPEKAKRWSEDHELAKTMLSEAGVVVRVRENK
jgi:dCMP deaminase